MSATFRFIAVLTTVLLAGLALLVVFDLLPLERLGAYAARIVIAGVILVLAAGLLSMLSRSRGP
ncbi:hypothetical protein [Pseudofulvimonas gallinarii]|jgi:hypothetical protein|uniref:Uncharacterized protein n=1 Tax=Pseudofulvimonas gallinarii TaxID=634155 RepID=A0A4R3L4D8_9GAMM|nr:hypothetical protein [Pseudofulvimonas gallinarii]TCS94439.1 hypothetical protein EDC25_12235 [Pseudofulvimonas gallinarii]THD11915.1 hypothetical protein B1808_14095 [Pseudofulvimonas gallinarii]